jgi:TetR/AcrR family transcriptional regulator
MKKQAVPPKGKELLILDAAQRLFASTGYSKSTMDEVALELGMSKASLYYYFPTKESVFRAVILREQQEFLVRAGAILERTCPARRKMMDYVRLRLELAERLMNLNRINQSPWHDIHPVFSELVHAFAHEEEQCLLKIMREGVASKEFALAKPKPMAGMILHALQGLRLRFVKSTKNLSTDTVVYREWREDSLLFAETVLDGITTTTV